MKSYPSFEDIFIRGSSNGRTPGFGPGYLGSNPSPRASLLKHLYLQVFLFIKSSLALFKVKRFIFL